MPLAFVTLGLLLVIVGFQDTYKQFGKQISTDIFATNGFIIWIAALGIIGSLGYVKGLEKPSRLFLVLIILVLFISNKGVFAKFSNAIGVPNATAIS